MFCHDYGLLRDHNLAKTDFVTYFTQGFTLGYEGLTPMGSCFSIILLTLI